MANSININHVRDPELIDKLNAICERRRPITINTLAKQLLHESTDHICEQLNIPLSTTQSAKAG